MAQIPLTGKDQYYRSVDLLPDNLINMIVMDTPTSSRSKQITTTRPGTSTLATLAAANVRGMAVNYANNELYVVSGNKFYEVNTSYTATERGTLSTSSGAVQIKVGLDNVAINPVGGAGTAYEFIPSTNTFAAVVDADYPTLDVLDYVDNYFIGIKPSDREIWLSEINDFSTWDALDFASAEALADNCVSILMHDRDVWVFKQTNTEIWFNSGDVFPFDRREYIPQGCIAKLSPVWADNNVYWLGQNDKGGVRIFKSQGYQAEDISPIGISYKLRSLTTPEDAEAYSFVLNDTTFILWTFPTDDLTICLNTKNMTFSEWQDDGGNRFAIRGIAYFNDTIIIGDPASGKILSLSKSNVDDDGTDFNFEIVTPTVISERKYIYCRRLEFDHEAGGGANNITLNVSKDGGNNYTSFGTQASGAANTDRMFYRGLGAGYTWTFKVSGTSAQTWDLFGLYGEFELGEY